MSTIPEGSDFPNGDEHRPNTESETELERKNEPETESELKNEPELESEPELNTEIEPVIRDADPNPEGNATQTSETDKPLAIVELMRPGLRKDEGNRTFTMQELLHELKDDEENESTLGASPYSLESTEKHLDDATLDLINSVTCVNEESQSRQRILTYAAKRYASALVTNPEDYDALYNWALVLQETADNVGPDSTSPSKDALLEEACNKYDDATRLCPTLHDAFYNWAIAISDRAKIRGRTNQAEELWKQAMENYEKAVQLNWNSPQALNNWGLALQELSAIVPAREKQTIVRTAISKFRAAIRLQLDFHRAIYNLGTVLYGLAEDTLRTGASNITKDVFPNDLYSLSAIYIAAAHALKPNYSVYSSALKLVRFMLPLPYLRVGYLTGPPVGNQLAPHSDWRRAQFVLNHEWLLQQSNVEQKQAPPRTPSGRSGDTGSMEKWAIRVDIPDIVSVSACADLTLPPGAGLCIDTIKGPVFLVADSWESLDGWLDAIRLVYTIYARSKSDVLAGIIL